MFGKHWKTCSVVLLNEVHNKAGSSQLVRGSVRKREWKRFQSHCSQEDHKSPSIKQQILDPTPVSQEILI